MVLNTGEHVNARKTSKEVSKEEQMLNVHQKLKCDENLIKKQEVIMHLNVLRHIK